MKRVVLIPAALVLTIVGANAQASDIGSFFVEGSAGQANYRTSDSQHDDTFHYSADRKDAAYAFRFGYRWHSVVDYGVEAGYADLGKLNDKFSLNNWPDEYHTKVGSRGYLLGGNLKYNFDNWYVSARAGWYRSRISQKYHYQFPGEGLPDENGSTHSTGTGEYAGLGVGYNFSQVFSLGLNYDNYHSREKYGRNELGQSTGFNTAVYSLSAEYRF